MSEKQQTFRVEMNARGTPPNTTFGWKIYRNHDVIPILRSQERFISRVAGLADANRSRRQLVEANTVG
jgi:hypothetical protein